MHVVLDQRVRDAQDVLRGAVVLLHQEHGRVGVVAFEVEDVLDGRAAPRVDALVGVADDADVAVPRGQQVDQLVLRAVRVLVLVDQDVAEPLLVVLQDLRVELEQLDGLGDQVVEVQGAGRVLAPLVLRVDARDGLLVEVVGAPGVGVLVHHLVLRPADGGGHRLGWEPLGIEVEILQHAGDQSLGVAVVVDREARRDAKMVVLATQDPSARGVERQDPHPSGDPSSDQTLDPVGHLARGLVRERDRQDRSG